MKRLVFFIALMLIYTIVVCNIAYAQVKVKQPVKKLNTLLLISPKEGEILDPGAGPVFRWRAPNNVQANAKYSITIKEIYRDQKPEKAVRSNKTIFKKKGINTSSFEYAAKDSKLVPGHKYAWTITIDGKDGSGIFSCFEVGQISMSEHEQIPLPCFGSVIKDLDENRVGCFEAACTDFFHISPGVTHHGLNLNDGSCCFVGTEQATQDIIEGKWDKYMISTTNNNHIIIPDYGCVGCSNPPCGMVAWYSMDPPAPIGWSGGTIIPNMVPNILDFDNYGYLASSTNIQFKYGKVYYGIHFVGGYLYEENNDNLLNFGEYQNFTIALWMQLEDDNSTGHNVIIDKRAMQDGKLRGYHVLYNRTTASGEGYFTLQLADGSANESVENYTFTRTNIDTGWHHIAIVARRTSSNPFVALYVDGVLVNQIGNNILKGDLTNVSPLRVGASNYFFDTDGSFKGMMDELQFYNRALFPDEIKSIHDAGAFGLCKPR